MTNQTELKMIFNHFLHKQNYIWPNIFLIVLKKVGQTSKTLINVVYKIQRKQPPTSQSKLIQEKCRSTTPHTKQEEKKQAYIRANILL